VLLSFVQNVCKIYKLTGQSSRDVDYAAWRSLNPNYTSSVPSQPHQLLSILTVADDFKADQHAICSFNSKSKRGILGRSQSRRYEEAAELDGQAGGIGWSHNTTKAGDLEVGRLKTAANALGRSYIRCTATVIEKEMSSYTTICPNIRHVATKFPNESSR